MVKKSNSTFIFEFHAFLLSAFFFPLLSSCISHEKISIAGNGNNIPFKSPSPTPETVSIHNAEYTSSKKIFSENFEEGLSKLTTFGDVSTVPEIGIGGSFCLKANYGTNKLLGSIIDLGSKAPTNEFYVRFYIKIDPAYNAPYLGFKWMRLKHGNVEGDGIQTEFYLNSETWYSTGHSYETDQGGLDSPDTNFSWYPTFKDGQWHKVEVYGKYNTSGLANGVCIIKFDDILHLNSKSYKWRSTMWESDIFRRFYIPSNAGDGVHMAQAGDIIYIDDIEIWDGTPHRLMYENFDTQTISPNLSVYGEWDSSIQGNILQVPPQYNLDQAGKNGQGFAFSSGTVNKVWISWDKGLPNPWPSDEMYFSFWMRYPTFTSTDSMENLKIFYPHWNGVDSYVHYSMSDKDTIYYSAKGNGAMISISNWLSCPNQTDGNWHHYEFYVKFSNAISRFWYDGELKIDHFYGPNVWLPNTMSYIAAPSIDAEESGVFSRQIDDWEVWDVVPN
ncbi:MAG: hypothetical protein A2504_01860 [Bdellovibrionales bacterium RIFOXYD12_FULL_39_22]|nr:MAG: hypothetical protein A2385_04385 [Bdellovibrionales bacterium RIFOXYB1_FULL_39_21]OFZ42348.1 MAG: hypothetical protein A2485_15110 [Bdellovibrionales bacterium RIFOXYC12_FULL_39_17]OFZ46351.1 MAG: hypothetical protein A2404_13905 [Bdellovibrionales bacterium RIFOXYC1_FULL_39_130]OFZ75244.1 MAG: hypothetical protein A2560_15960 [Bdellovibrionales bacterium RIFOXYD1_FULL_39_84]OFZ93238.1 MAG: hypothetical protein A2504_01860 [Bdellovibrionales bacterium RIFOXYD12_FULL_39_22]